MDVSDFKQYDVIHITAISKPPNISLIKGSEGYLRLPQVGDKATIVEIYGESENIGFEVECVDKEGHTLWLGTFKPEELRFILLQRYIPLEDIPEFIGKIITSFYGIDKNLDSQLKICTIKKITHTVVGMYIDLGLDPIEKEKLNKIVIDTNPINGPTFKTDETEGQCILFTKEGYINFIEIFTYYGQFPMLEQDLQKLKFGKLDKTIKTNHSADYIKNIDRKSFPEIFDLEITTILITNTREIVFFSKKNNIRFSLHKPLSYTLDDFPCFSSDIYKSSSECCEIQILKEGEYLYFLKMHIDKLNMNACPDTSSVISFKVPKSIYFAACKEFIAANVSKKKLTKKRNNLLHFIKTRFVFILIWKLVNRIKLQNFYKVDFFKYVPKEQQIFLLLDANRFLNNESLIWSIDRSPKTPDITEGRHFFADSENLAEGGVLKLLDQMTGVFNKNKIDLKYSQEFIYTTPHDYTIKINNIEYEIFSIKDLNNPKLWGIATINTMEMLNDIFIRHNLNERVYSLYCGTNECIFYIATPEIIKLLINLHKEIPQEVNYWKKLL